MDKVHAGDLQSLLAGTSGLTHDLGKATLLFQEKLLNPDFPIKDPIRHEWVSLLVLDALFREDSIAEAFEGLPALPQSHAIPFNKARGIYHPKDILRFIVSTHHGLFGPRLEGSYKKSKALAVDSSKHVRKVDNHPLNNHRDKYLALAAPFDEDVVQGVADLLSKVKHIEPRLTPYDAKALAIVIRAALILADHTVSSRSTRHETARLAANPIHNELKGGRRIPRQDLNYHLKEAGLLSQTYSQKIREYIWPGLHDSVICGMTAESGPGRFAWQDHACKSMTQLRTHIKGPVLVLNVAGTGCGKTRMNAKALAILNRRQALRFSTALNLRTLTLQTGTAYQTELNIPKNDLQCIIGDKEVRALYKYQCAKGEPKPHNTDENGIETIFEGSNTTTDIPPWLDEYSQMTGGQGSIISPAVLVSTIDFLIAAGDPTRQGHHGAAIMRIANSDLILDEIDDYDSEAFVAVLRLVEIAAMLGANIVASSATLPTPMADALMRAFMKGAQAGKSLNMGVSIEGEMPAIMMIDEVRDPAVILTATLDYSPQYRAFVKRDDSLAIKAVTKKPRLIELEEISPNGFKRSVLNSINKLHNEHRWEYSESGKAISIGLVRCANIQTAIELAGFLASALPDDLIATYHARDFRVQRHRKEAILDVILNRKDGNTNLEASPYIQALVGQATTQNLKLIVIATPVEEVGRDHDFDWGVIEPSSVRSIVQSSGRINRHRLIPVSEANIHILNYNYRACSGKTPIFSRPGYEPSRGWDEHNLKYLLPWESITEISAQLRFNDHRLCLLENDAINEVIQDPVSKLLLEKPNKLLEWTAERFYRGFPLRSFNSSDTWRYNVEAGVFEMLEKGPLGEDFVARDSLIQRVETPVNTWLNWSIEENIKFSSDVGIELLKAFEFTTPRYGNKEAKPAGHMYSLGFGFM